MNRLLILTLVSITLAACIFFFKKREPTTLATGEGLVIPHEWLKENPKSLTPLEARRPPDQTFLTYPEWFLVFSPEEQARYFEHHTSSTFPFTRHTAQIWESYKIVSDQVENVFPRNTGYHFMIWVIGSSASVEYVIKAWYETLVGRMTDTEIPITEEDKFNATFTRDYVDFIKDKPWYEFDFKSRLKSLWTATAVVGSHFPRKLERRYLLTTELLVKYVYGKLIGLGTQQVYEAALPTTAVLLSNDSLLYLPRYDQFANAAMDLSRKGYRFKEIAGNNSAILLSVVVPANTSFGFENTRTVFVQPLTSAPAYKRIVAAVPVSSLNQILLQIDSAKIEVEHIFDY